MNAPNNNIVNCEKWGDNEWLSYFKDRFMAMKSKREPFEKRFNDIEKQETLISFYDNLWNLQIRVPLEKNLIENYLWRTNWKVNFQIIPDWQTDIEELQPSIYALNFFLDWNWKETFWMENKEFRHQKRIYGTWIWYTWIRSYKDYRYNLKEWAVIESEIDIQNKENFDEIENETRFFFPKNLHIKDFYVDDRALWQTDIQKASDCIYKEKLTYLEFDIRYWNNKNIINRNSITSGIDESPKNQNDQSVEQDEIILYHYFHKIKKIYLIISDKDVLIYRWLYLYNDWKLPFEVVQHYPVFNCMYWDWIPTRIQYLKAFKSEILQDILIGARMWNRINIINGNDDEIRGEWDVWGRGLNVWTTTWWAENVKEIKTQINLAYYSNVLQIIDDLVVQDTWDNPRAVLESGEKTLWQTEILETNRAIRQSAVDENYNIWLDNILTMMLSRIKQFASSLLSEKVIDSEWKIIKQTFPKIRIDWYEVKKEDWKTVYVENLGKYGYFELKPWVVQGLGVKVVTSSTNPIMQVIERDKIDKKIENIIKLWNLIPIIPEIWQKLAEKIDVDDLFNALDQAYWYDSKMKANTTKDKIKQAQNKKIIEIKNKLSLLNNQTTNENQNQWNIQESNMQNPASQELQNPVWNTL